MRQQNSGTSLLIILLALWLRRPLTADGHRTRLGALFSGMGRIRSSLAIQPLCTHSDSEGRRRPRAGAQDAGAKWRARAEY